MLKRNGVHCEDTFVEDTIIEDVLKMHSLRMRRGYIFIGCVEDTLRIQLKGCWSWIHLHWDKDCFEPKYSQMSIWNPKDIHKRAAGIRKESI